MKNIVIKNANRDDIPLIMDFIGNYWKKGHILSERRNFFEWQYCNGQKVNFVIAMQERHIKGILGYIPYGNSSDCDIALALWKVIKTERPFLGAELLDYIIKNISHRFIFCNGISWKTTEPIYRLCGFETGKLNQYYRLNPNIDYKIAKIKTVDVIRTDNIKSFLTYKVVSLNDLEKFNFEKYKKSCRVPFKSKEYIFKRYLCHPVYKYNLNYICDPNRNLEVIYVLRKQEYNKSCALRLVDIIGDVELFPEITHNLDNDMTKELAEYVDIYETGLDEEILERSGWKDVNSSENIIPNYFEPFEQRNVDIFYASMNKDIIIFKGDGDQDRPSLL